MKEIRRIPKKDVPPSETELGKMERLADAFVKVWIELNPEKAKKMLEELCSRP
jgi:DNA-directed RNA polymerase subunit F